MATAPSRKVARNALPSGGKSSLVSSVAAERDEHARDDPGRVFPASLQADGERDAAQRLERQHDRHGQRRRVTIEGAGANSRFTFMAAAIPKPSIKNLSRP